MRVVADCRNDPKSAAARYCASVGKLEREGLAQGLAHAAGGEEAAAPRAHPPVPLLAEHELLGQGLFAWAAIPVGTPPGG